MNFISFFINPPCSAAAQWMAIEFILEGSVVGKASTIGKEISPTPLNFHRGVKKCKISRRLNITQL